MVIAETIPQHTQRLYRLLGPKQLDVNLYEQLVAAEEAIYASASNSMVNWGVEERNVHKLWTFAAIALSKLDTWATILDNK